MRLKAPPRPSQPSAIHSTAPRVETLATVTKNSKTCWPRPRQQEVSPVPEATRDQGPRTSRTKASDVGGGVSESFLFFFSKILKYNVFSAEDLFTSLIIHVMQEMLHT